MKKNYQKKFAGVGLGMVWGHRPTEYMGEYQIAAHFGAFYSGKIKIL